MDVVAVTVEDICDVVEVVVEIGRVGYNDEKCCGVWSEFVVGAGLLANADGIDGRCTIDGLNGVILDGKVGCPVHDERKWFLLEWIGDDWKKGWSSTYGIVVSLSSTGYDGGWSGLKLITLSGFFVKRSKLSKADSISHWISWW